MEEGRLILNFGACFRLPGRRIDDRRREFLLAVLGQLEEEEEKKELGRAVGLGKGKAGPAEKNGEGKRKRPAGPC